MQYPDTRLTVPAPPSAGVDDALRAIGARLLAAAREARAYGLAAVHVGDVAPVVVISGESEPRDYQLLFNPRITARADTLARGEEGSVSLPGVRVEIERPVWVELACMDGDGSERQLRLEGFAARVALHEIEQMQGIFFLSRISRLKREMALKRAKKSSG